MGRRAREIRHHPSSLFHQPVGPVGLIEDPAEGEGTGGSARTPCLQFGKVKGGRFSCDLRYPMSYMQAFGIFLSSFYWLPLLDEQEADGGGAEA